MNRRLRDYSNADRESCSGMIIERDDTAALQAALNEGPGIVTVDSGDYRWGNVSVPETSEVVCQGV